MALVSTALACEINPVGSFGGEIGLRLAKSPMMSVRFWRWYPLPCSKFPKIKTIRESVFYRLIPVIGMRSDIIGRVALRSLVFCTDIIGKYRDHRWLSTGSGLQAGTGPLALHSLTGTAPRSSVGRVRGGAGGPPRQNGSEIIGHSVSLMACLLPETANEAIVGHQTHRSGFRWPPMRP